jgi:very-short-patch-repair endonuclease
MFKLIIFILIVAILLIVVEFIFGKRKKFGYEYRKRNFFMTKSESEFFHILQNVIGEKYYIFAQVHLPTLVDHKIKGQNWFGAFRHISEKSVDFVLCDKINISPKLAIELDDKSHEREDRIRRDGEVEKILKEAGFPLLRIKTMNSYDQSWLLKEIDAKLLELK